MNRIISTWSVALTCALLLAATSWAQTTPKPGPKTHLNGKASSMVELTIVGDTSYVGIPNERAADGTTVSATMPAGAVLVLTDVECEAVGSTSGLETVTIRIPSSGGVIEQCKWDTTVEGMQHQIDWTSGAVLSEIPEVAYSDSNTGSVRVRLRGYYAKDK